MQSPRAAANARLSRLSLARQKQVCVSGLTIFCWGQDFSATRRCGLSPGTALPRIRPGRGGALAPQPLSDLQGKSFQMSWLPPLRARLPRQP